jgi:hypothetical protein
MSNIHTKALESLRYLPRSLGRNRVSRLLTGRGACAEVHTLDCSYWLVFYETLQPH